MRSMSAPKRSFLLRAWRFGWWQVLRFLAYIWCAVEYLFFLLLHLRRIRQAEYVYPLWFWSFGHQATDPHMLALRFHGKKLLVLLSDYGNFSPYIVDAFRPHLDIVDFRQSRWLRHFLPALTSVRVTRMKQRILSLVLYLFRCRTQVVHTFYERFGLPMEGYYHTEYLRLLSSSEPNVVHPRREHVQQFRDMLRREHHILDDRWFVSFYFRRKHRNPAEVRDTQPATYKEAISLVTQNGGWVFCGGDCDPREEFPGMEHVFGYRDFPCDRSLCDLFFLTQCAFLVCGQSGPLAMAIAFATPTLVANAALYYITGCRDNQRICYKKLVERRTGRALTAREIFRLPTLCLNSNAQFDRADLVHVDNTPEELCAAVEEMLAFIIFRKDITHSAEYGVLYRRFHEMLPPESFVAQTSCMPTLGCLRALRLEE